MSAKAIYEATGKDLLNRHLSDTCAKCRFASVNEATNFDALVAANPWLHEQVGAVVAAENKHAHLTRSRCYRQKLVVKPDQLIKRRGKLGLIKVNATVADVKQWIGERIGKEQQVTTHITGHSSAALGECQGHAFATNCYVLTPSC